MTITDKSAIMRQEIMINMKANKVPVTGKFWLALVFRTESELKKICQEMHIKIP